MRYQTSRVQTINVGKNVQFQNKFERVKRVKLVQIKIS